MVKRRSHEQEVINAVHSACNRLMGGLPTADDAASTIIERMWRLGHFAWEMGRVRAYAAKSAYVLRIQYLKQRTKAASEFQGDDDSFNILELRRHATPPNQEQYVEAMRALALVRALPLAQRDCLLILADGGSPLDVANDLGIEAWDAIRLIKEARGNVGRVDPKAA